MRSQDHVWLQVLKYASPANSTLAKDVHECGAARKRPQTTPFELALLTGNSNAATLVIEAMEPDNLVKHLQPQHAADSSALCRWGT